MPVHLYDRQRFARRHGHEAGVALLLVLWVLLLLTAIALSFSYSTRVGVQSTQNLIELARLKTLANAGVQRAIHELLRTDAERWQADGREHTFSLDDARIVVVLRDEAARIDLNAAPDALLASLLRSAGLDAQTADALLDAILDWRDPDDLPRPLGAEREQYEAEGLEHVPANAPFTEVSELLWVRGITPALYRRLAPALTVHSGQAGIDSRVAERVVLMALPNVVEEDVDAFLATRAQLLADGLPPLPFPAAQAFELGHGSGVYNIRSLARLANGLGHEIDVSVRITSNSRMPVQFLRLRERVVARVGAH